MVKRKMLVDTAIIQFYPIVPPACRDSLLELLNGDTSFRISLNDNPLSPLLLNYLNGLVPGVILTINPIEFSLTFKFTPSFNLTNINIFHDNTIPRNRFLRFFFLIRPEGGASETPAQLKLIFGLPMATNTFASFSFSNYFCFLSNICTSWSRHPTRYSFCSITIQSIFQKALLH